MTVPIVNNVPGLRNNYNMTKLRQDSHFIASKPSLHNTITNGMDGIIDESAYESRLLLATYLQEANVVFKILSVNNLESQETLFKSYKELKEAAQKFKISDFYKKKMPYLREIQGRSNSISLIKRILNGEKVKWFGKFWTKTIY